jgi:hypothetical protein
VSPSGSIDVVVTYTDEMMQGVVAYPHGWVHQGGGRVADRSTGANANLLASTEPSDLEPLAAMSHLNGIPVGVEPLAVDA